MGAGSAHHPAAWNISPNAEMKTADVRSSFLKFFEERAHRVVPSDSLIPSTDPSLLFTSAGMVQFKPNFQNPATSPFRRAASCQKCLRTSDIERVGYTLRHLTFFEMLGNFSFGDYFKKDAIAWGWEFLTKRMGLPADRFVVSVFKNDDEAFALWEKLVPRERIYRLDEDTNFWTMGPTGPCGPCSEILYDRGPEWGCNKKTCSPACDCDRYLEVWNLVFTQFDRSEDGKLSPLPQKNIDTGMGLERLSLLMQGKSNPFETDGFQALFTQLAEIAHRAVPKETRGVPSPETAAFRRIADHARAITFMIADGILPSNEGRGYVLRRLLRQAVRAGKTLGIQKPFVFQLTGTVIDTMQSAYPETLQRRETVASVVKTEEEKFLETLDTGTRRLEELVLDAKAKKQTVLPGREVFQLYDTFGFPFELTKEMAEAAGLQVDAEAFKKAQQQAVELARQAWKGSGAQDVDHYREWKAKLGVTSRFVGYDLHEPSVEVKLLSSFYAQTPSGWKEVKRLEKGQEGELVLPETTLYAEGGGQVGDQGVLTTETGRALIVDTQAPIEGFTVHRVMIDQGYLEAGQRGALAVDLNRREATMRHHTSTHMLHKALRDVLGPHVTQAGSLVAPDRLRFDFNHNAPLTAEQKERVEDLVNGQILRDLHVRSCPMSKNEAHKIGAMMLFGEKYGEEVRAVAVTEHNDCDHIQQAWSLELCGGTHVHKTGQIGIFKIIGQSSVSAGVRRIEAVAGWSALQAIRKTEQQLATVADSLKTSPEELLPRIDKLIAHEKSLEKELEKLRSTSLRSQFDDILKAAKTVGGVNFVSHRIDGLDNKRLSEVADRLRDSGKLGLVLVASVQDSKVSFVVSTQKEISSRGLAAGAVAKEFAALIEGSGGGRPDFAQGGGKNVAELDHALAKVEDILKRLSVKTPHKPA